MNVEARIGFAANEWRLYLFGFCLCVFHRRALGPQVKWKNSVSSAAGLAAEQSFDCRNAKSLKVLFQ